MSIVIQYFLYVHINVEIKAFLETMKIMIS